MERTCEIELYNLGLEARGKEQQACGQLATWVALGMRQIDTCDLHLGDLPKEVWTVGPI